MPRKRRWRATIGQTATTTQPVVESPTKVLHAKPTPLPAAEIRHVGLIITLLFVALLATTILLQTGSNQATLDSYLSNLLN